jgi:hypothetical protein
MIDTSDRLRSALADRYRIESELGAGGMATVHLATDLKHHRKVAVKVLRAELGSEVARDRFLREIETLGHLRHPHILPLLDSGTIDELCYFVMPYCEGETLRERLDREAALPIEDALQYSREIAEALAYAHTHGVIHRDVKPQNIMLESGHAVLADFGIALTTDETREERLTRTGHSPGTPHYMSPEQAATDPRLDARSDIYSLGCVLYEMLVGQPPFVGPNLMAIHARHAVEMPPGIRVVRDTVPRSLETVVFCALAKAPADRFPTAAEFVRAIEEVARERVRQTGPANGSTGPATATGEPRGTFRCAGEAPTAAVLRVLAGIAAALIVPTMVGFLTIRAFDVKVGLPEQISPSRSDYLTVGLKALIGPFVNGSLLVLAFLVVFYAARFLHALVGRAGAPGRTMQSAADRLRAGWFEFWGNARPDTVADCFFITAVVSSAFLLAASWPLVSAHFTTETAVFGCDHRPLQRSTNVALAGLIFALAFGWHGVFAWLRRRYGRQAPGGVARWGSLAVILLLIFAVTLPWRLMWAGGDERVLINGERAYVLGETKTHVILHNAERRTTAVYALDELPPLQRLGVSGHVFEEPAVFHSGAPDCTGTY